MARIPCARCGTPYAEGNLLYTDDGQICVDCESALEDQRAHTGKIRSLIWSGPIISFAGLGMLCGGFIPMLGVLFLGVAPFLGLFGIVQGGRAILAANREPDLDGSQKTGLLVSGVVTILWCLSVMAMGTLMLISSLLGMAMMSTY